MYTSIPISWHTPLPPPPFSSLVSIFLFSTSVSLYLPCKLCGDRNGKEIQNREVDEYLELTHFSKQQELTPCCKTNKPELKKKKKQQCSRLSISDAARYYPPLSIKNLWVIGHQTACYKDPRLHFNNMTRVVTETSTAFPMLLCGFSFQVCLLTNMRPPRM